MRKSRKFAVVAGSTVGALAIGGVAFAYWTTSGSGSGTATTSAGATNTLTITNTTVTGLAPDIAAKPIAISVKNTGDQSVYVTHLDAYLTVVKASDAPTGTCDETDYLVNGAAVGGDSTHATRLTWTAVELAKDATSGNSSNTIQFNNKSGVNAANQDACKGATVTINYVAS